jgi:enterochelin esterase-like enzyme
LKQLVMNLLAFGLLSICATAPACADAPSYGSIVEYKAMKSAFIPPADVIVWLPPGYKEKEARGRYAVLYMQDGQNLFDLAAGRTTSPWGKAWGVDTIAAGLMAKGAIRPVIVVGVAHMGVERARQYVPRGVFDRLSGATRERLAKEFGGAPFSDDYLRFLVKELKPFIDTNYRTDPARDSTFVMGSSMGGLISLYALLEYPAVFGGAACLSTHWPLLIPTATGLPMKDGRPLFESEVSAAFESYLRERMPLLVGHRIWFDHGTEGLDANYAPYQERIDAMLANLGWKPGRDFESKVYPGASHNEDAWRARLADLLTFLLGSELPQHIAQ